MSSTRPFGRRVAVWLLSCPDMAPVATNVPVAGSKIKDGTGHVGAPGSLPPATSTRPSLSRVVVQVKSLAGICPTAVN